MSRMLRAERPAGGKQHGQPPLGQPEPGHPAVTEPPKPGRGSQQPPSQPERPGCAAPAAGSPAAPSGLRHPASRAGRPIRPLSLLRRHPLVGEPPAKALRKNAQEFLKPGRMPGVMAQYAPGLFSTLQHTHRPTPPRTRTPTRCSSLWSGAKTPLTAEPHKKFSVNFCFTC